MKIIISRTDNLGDVILTLPLALRLKKLYPQCQLGFIGKTYTRPLIELCPAIDEFINCDQLSSDLKADLILHVFPNRKIQKLARQIPLRIGSARRWRHWLSCNRLVFFSRKKSSLHEAQLNFYLLKPLLEKFAIPSLAELKTLPTLNADDLPADPHVQQFLHPHKINLILHPLSNLSAPEWGQENFSTLIEKLDAKKYQILITGTQQEGQRLQEKILIPHQHKVIDTTGKLTLTQLISLINGAHGLIAASTGPLHISAALGKPTLGLFVDQPIIGPQRWAPLGPQAEVLCAPAGSALSQISVDSVLRWIDCTI